MTESDPERRVASARRLPGAAAAVIGLVIVIGFVLRTEFSDKMLASKYTLFRVPIDFLVYYRGGAVVAGGGEVYSEGLVGRLPFTYPPFSAWLFSFLSNVPVVPAAVVWQLVMLFLLLCVVFAVIVKRGYRGSVASLLFAGLVVLAAFVLNPVRTGFYYGQINVALMALVAVDVLRSPKNSWRSDVGVATGVAAGIKLVPAFFWLVFIVRRQWWALARSVAAFAVTVGLGLLFVRDASRFWGEKMLDSSRVGSVDNPGAQSVLVVLKRVVGVDSLLVWVVVCLVLVALVGVVLWRAHQLGHRSLEMAVAGIAMVMVSPFSWMHHWVWVLPMLLVAGDAVVRVLPYWWGTLLAMCLVVLLAVPLVSRHVVPALALSAQQKWGLPFALGYSWWGLVVVAGAAVVLWSLGRMKSTAELPGSSAEKLSAESG